MPTPTGRTKVPLSSRTPQNFIGAGRSEPEEPEEHFLAQDEGARGRNHPLFAPAEDGDMGGFADTIKQALAKMTVPQMAEGYQELEVEDKRQQMQDRKEGMEARKQGQERAKLEGKIRAQLQIAQSEMFEEDEKACAKEKYRDLLRQLADMD